MCLVIIFQAYRKQHAGKPEQLRLSNYNQRAFWTECTHQLLELEEATGSHISLDQVHSAQAVQIGEVKKFQVLRGKESWPQNKCYLQKLQRVLH